MIHNWYEDRTPNETKEFPTNSTYNLDFKPYPDAKPDLILKRKILGGSEGIGGKNLIGMHNFDSSKNITGKDKVAPTGNKLELSFLFLKRI